VKKLNAYGAGLPLMEDAGCGHLFETWCALHQRGNGKRYKDWLLSRGRRDLDTIQSGVMLLVRNVVREWVRDSRAGAAELSLDTPIPEAHGCTLIELLPASGESKDEEGVAWAERKAAALVASVDPLQRAVLMVRAQGRVFSHPQVRADTGFGKTALHRHHRQLLEQVAQEVKEAFPGLSAEEGSRVVLSTLDQAGQLILSQKDAEN
jgi:hypothetical protein